MKLGINNTISQLEFSTCPMSIQIQMVIVAKNPVLNANLKGFDLHHQICFENYKKYVFKDKKLTLNLHKFLVSKQIRC